MKKIDSLFHPFLTKVVKNYLKISFVAKGILRQTEKLIYSI